MKKSEPFPGMNAEEFRSAGYQVIDMIAEYLDLTGHGELYEKAALRVGMKFETIGFLVYKGVVPIDAMEDLVGGAALSIWSVLHQWVSETRERRNHPTFMEWYQWLINQVLERDRDV